jgi:UDP-N-acetylenolpyruvoylglucosamine reductase
VKNGNTETTATAFTQAAPFNFDIQTTSAGCNFDNTVSLTKSANGLVNAAPSGYDSSEFTAKIPYKATVGVSKAVNAGATGTGIYHAFVVDVAQASGSMHLGAWRSGLTLNINAPAQTLGLVAGTYTDTITLTLAVDTAS